MKFIIDVTSKCNLRCKHCGNVLEEETSINFNEIIKKIKFEITDVEILGGEPFLFENIFELLNYLDENKINYSIVTNGQFLDNIIDKISKLKYLRMLAVSFEGNQIENDAIRGLETYKKAKYFIDTLFKLKENLSFDIGCNITINSLNIGKLDLSEFLIYDFININEMLPYGRAQINGLCVDKNIYFDEIERLCLKYSNYIDSKIKIDVSNPNFVYYLNTKYKLDLKCDNKPCGAGKESFYISNKGIIYPCREIKSPITINKKNIKKYAEFVESNKFKKPSVCLECDFANQCFECPLKENSKYIDCIEADKRMKEYLNKVKKIIFLSEKML